MVLRLKTRESRSLPGLPNATRMRPKLKSFGKLHAKTKMIFSTINKRPLADPKGRSQSGLSALQNTKSSKEGSRLWSGASLTGDKSPSAICSGSTRHSPAVTQSRQTSKRFALGAGWSSPVARQAHNLKAAGSNPAPATNLPNTGMLLQNYRHPSIAGEPTSSACGP